MKLAIWLKDGIMVRHAFVADQTVTVPEPGLPVWITSFSEKGELVQTDLYSVGGSHVIVSYDLAIAHGPAYQPQIVIVDRDK